MNVFDVFCYWLKVVKHDLFMLLCKMISQSHLTKFKKTNSCSTKLKQILHKSHKSTFIQSSRCTSISSSSNNSSFNVSKFAHDSRVVSFHLCPSLSLLCTLFSRFYLSFSVIFVVLVSCEEETRTLSLYFDLFALCREQRRQKKS